MIARKKKKPKKKRQPYPRPVPQHMEPLGGPYDTQGNYRTRPTPSSDDAQ